MLGYTLYTVCSINVYAHSENQSLSYLFRYAFLFGYHNEKHFLFSAIRNAMIVNQSVILLLECCILSLLAPRLGQKNDFLIQKRHC